ncbi:hypothetical protein [uncultured Roseibium sp.]|uniref:hypothetical protein n=1 Tax=uncultured Roseibium sp. TaxID=1936171 RepID=UPI002631E1C4|nr:hypothetical protein [uncultured Roseibium sp.]
MPDLFGEDYPHPDDVEVVTLVLPIDWLDESCPTPVEDPYHFCAKNSEGHWRLRPAPGDHLWVGNENFDLPVSAGELVRFAEYRLYPDVTLTVFEGGDFQTVPPAPADANLFYLADCEGMADDIKTIVKCGGFWCDPLEPGDYQLSCRYWSGPVFYEFQVADGVPGFIRRGPVQ